MGNSSDDETIRTSIITRGVYCLVLLSFVFPYILQLRRLMTLREQQLTHLLAASYSVLVVSTIALVAALRIFWIVSGKSRLECPRSSALISTIRNTGLVFLYLGFLGGFVSVIAVVAKLLPAILPAIYGHFFSTAAIFGILLFESGRLLAYEANTA